MQKNIEIVAYGSLERTLSQSSHLPVMNRPEPLRSLLERIGIPPGSIQLAMVNHRAAHPETIVSPGDRVALFPPEYPIFADWMGFRSAT